MARRAPSSQEETEGGHDGTEKWGVRRSVIRAPSDHEGETTGQSSAEGEERQGARRVVTWSGWCRMARRTPNNREDQEQKGGH